MVMGLCLCVHAAYAQNVFHPLAYADYDGYTILDTAYMRVEYSMHFRVAAGYRSEEQYKRTIEILDNSVPFEEGDLWKKDKRLVEFGASVRKDYSHYLETLEAANEVRRNNGENAFYTGLEGPVNPYELVIMKDGTNRMTCRLLHGAILQYDEPSEVMQWRLTEKNDTLLGYACKSAECDFRGRTWEAWYCPDIPVDGGPYKFCGLPGLIMKVVDTQSHYKWEAQGIEQGEWPLGEKNLVMVEKNSRQKVRRTIENMYKYPMKFILAINPKTYMPGPSGKFELISADDPLSLVYDPIELE